MIYIKITIVYFKERQNYKYDMYTEFTTEDLWITI